MSTIKPLLPTVVSAPAGGVSIQGPAGLDPTAAAAPTASSEGVSATQRTLAQLAAGAITPDQAVARLTDAAVAGSGATGAARAVVEDKVRALLHRDPNVAALLSRMGATTPEG